MKLVQALAPDSSDLLGDTPALRLFALLELMAGRDRLYTLQDLVEETGYPKPTLHRMLGQLEAAGLLQREHDGRHYGTGVRLRQLAENLLLNNSLNSARHRVLRQLVEELGESCNITTLMGGEVVYLDRVETAAPLRFYLHPGSRVPAHCSASGKLFLAQMSPAQRRKLLAYAPLQSYTPKTLVKLSALEQEFRQIRHDGYAFDNEEFLPGLICLAVGVPSQQGRASVCVAVQAPILRCSRAQALDWLPALQKAATALSQIGTDASDSATPSKPSTPATALS